MHAKAQEGTQRHTNARECARQHASSNIEVALEHGVKLLGLAVVEWVGDVKHGVVLVDHCVDEYESYDYAYLKMLAEKLVTKKPAAHRPRRAVGAQRIQPHGDSASEDEEEEDDGSDEDLDEI